MKVVQAILIVLLLAFPYSYFAMFMHYEVGNIISYVVGFIIFAIVTLWAARQRLLIAYIIGSVLTVITSYWFASREHDERWESMFYSFEPAQYSIAVSVAFIGLTAIVYYFTKAEKRQSYYSSRW